MESAQIHSPPPGSFFANSIANLVFPPAVGPSTRIIGQTLVMCNNVRSNKKAVPIPTKRDSLVHSSGGCFGKIGNHERPDKLLKNRFCLEDDQ